MTRPTPSAILNSSLPPRFRQIRLELARQPGHPEGEASIAYVIVAPLDEERPDRRQPWRKHQENSRVARQRPLQADVLGHLVHRPGGSWAFKYENGDQQLPRQAITSSDERPAGRIRLDQRGRKGAIAFRVVGGGRE